MQFPSISGEVATDLPSRIRYATDASVYREMPVAVAFPKTVDDIAQLLTFAKQQHLSVIPRAAGTQSS